MSDVATTKPGGRARGWVRARPWPALVVASWAASRVLYWTVGGVRFDTDSLDVAYQFVHRDLLEHDLWTSLWHLHAQPPLFNAFLGVVLRLPGDPQWTFGVAFGLCGLALSLLMFLLAVDLGVPRPAAAVAAAVFSATPAAVFYEHYLFYTLPVATLLCAAALALVRFLRSLRPGYALSFFSAITALALVRATYHLVWVAAAVALVLWATRGRVPARTLALLALPTVLVPGLYVKNAIQFDTFSASSWMGMNLARLTLGQADPDEIDLLVDQGALSDQARIYPFEDLDTFGLEHDPTGAATLDRRWRGDPAGGDPNLNNLDYVEISRQYQRDAIAYLRRHPGEYAGTVLTALRLYLLPTSFNPHVGNNLLPVYDFTKATWVVVDLQPRPYESALAFFPTADTRRYAPGWTQVSLTAVASYAIVALGWPLYLRRRRTRERAAPGLDRAARLTLGFVSATVTFALLAGIMLEIGENNRFRFETDPLAVTLTVAFVAACLAGRVARRG